MSKFTVAIPVIVLAVAAIAGAACGSSKKVSSVACLDESATQQAVDAASGATPAAQGTEDELTCRLRKASLAATDLPSGWTLTQSGGAPIYPGSRSGCGVPFNFKAVGPKQFFGIVADSTAAAGAKSSAAKVLSETVFLFEHGAARQLMQSMRETCAIQTAVPGEGDATAVTSAQPQYYALELPSIGDESIAYRVEAAGRLTLYSVLIRQGDVVIQISATVVTADELAQIAKVAYQKVADSRNYVQSAVK